VSHALVGQISVYSGFQLFLTLKHVGPLSTSLYVYCWKFLRSCTGEGQTWRASLIQAIDYSISFLFTTCFVRTQLVDHIGLQSLKDFDADKYLKIVYDMLVRDLIREVFSISKLLLLNMLEELPHSPWKRIPDSMCAQSSHGKWEEPKAAWKRVLFTYWVSCILSLDFGVCSFSCDVR